MDTRSILDQLLKAAPEVLGGLVNPSGTSTGNPSPRSGSGGGLGDLLGGATQSAPESPSSPTPSATSQGASIGSGLDDLVAGASRAGPASTPRPSGGSAGSGGGGGLGGLFPGGAGGTLAAAILAMLLGSRRGRSGGKGIGAGGLAAIGMLAYQAFQKWQRQQGGKPLAAPQTIDKLLPEQAEQHSQAILAALIAAAKADGHIDEQELLRINAEVSRISEDTQLVGWLQNELHKPLDPKAVASAAHTPELAAEIYLASVLAVDEQDANERAYLDTLGRELKLDPGLCSELENQLKQAA